MAVIAQNWLKKRCHDYQPTVYSPNDNTPTAVLCSPHKWSILSWMVNAVKNTIRLKNSIAPVAYLDTFMSWFSFDRMTFVTLSWRQRRLPNEKFRASWFFGAMTVYQTSSCLMTMEQHILSSRKYKLTEGSSEKVNRQLFKNQYNVILNIFLWLNLSAVFKSTLFIKTNVFNVKWLQLDLSGALLYSW